MSYSVDDVVSNVFKKMNDIGQFFEPLIAQEPWKQALGFMTRETGIM